MTADTIAPGDGDAAGDPGPARDSRSFPCDSCGAPLSFSIGAQRLRCGPCGFEKALGFAAPRASGEAEHDLAQGLSLQAARRARRAPAQPARQELACKACGAIAVFEGSLTATRCSYCDSPLQLSDAHGGQHPIPLDGLCTFRVEDAEAKARVRQWVRGRWFAPGAWKKRGVEGRFDGVYMPFFTHEDDRHPLLGRAGRGVLGRSRLWPEQAERAAGALEPGLGHVPALLRRCLHPRAAVAAAAAAAGPGALAHRAGDRVQRGRAGRQARPHLLSDLRPRLAAGARRLVVHTG